MNTNDSELEPALRRQAAAFRPDTPPDLPRKIRSALAASVAPADYDPPRLPGWVWWSGAGGAIAAVLVGLLAFRTHPVPADPHADAAALAQEIQGMRLTVQASLRSHSAASPQGDPLHQEATALADSAHSALGFLAYNFLPSARG
ncbi:MAG TPA: hypothetical protein VGL42_16565 [Opitutaceae bacterium]|jgi:hypothetical protein